MLIGRPGTNFSEMLIEIYSGIRENAFENVVWKMPAILSRPVYWKIGHQGLALLTLSWDKNWDSHSLVNGYPSFYPKIALVAPSPG